MVVGFVLMLMLDIVRRTFPAAEAIMIMSMIMSMISA